MKENLVIGIDYGSKMAGTTVLCYLKGKQVKWHCSEKKKDADQMILKLLKSLKPRLVGIDAPLSLPGVYRQLEGYEDYFYRQCDRELKAMSPMFLGGLTARAMKLSAQYREANFVEVYPVQTGKALGLDRWGYRTKGVETEAILHELMSQTGWYIDLSDPEVSAHHIDAVLALMVAHRQATGKARQVGHPDEGLIYC